MILKRIQNLWHYGSLHHPSERPVPRISDQRWRWIVRAWGGPLRDQAFLHRHPWSNANWIRNLYLCGARGRLTRAVVLGAIAGLLLVLSNS